MSTTTSSTSTSSAGITPTTVNGVTRISGLSSGVDVDSIVSKLMAADKGTLNKLNQQKQIDTWKQQQFRTITTDINTFASKYLDLTSSTSILSQSNFQQFTVTSDNSDISVAAGANAVNGSHTIAVSQLATAGMHTSATNITKDVEGVSTPNYAALKGTSFNITVDGTTRTVSFDSDYNSFSETGVQYVQDAINTAIGTTTDSNGNTINKLNVSTDSNGNLTFMPTLDSGVGSISICDGSSNGSFASLGFSGSSSLSNRLSTSDTLATIAGKLKSNTAFTFDPSGELEFSINGEKFSFDKSDTLSDMISTINKDTKANVTMKYDQNTDQITLTANNTGAGKTISISDMAGTFATNVLSTWNEGKDAQVVLDGQKLTRSSNTITQDGVTYTINKTTTTSAAVSVAQNVDGIYTMISNFVNDYNKLLDEINGKLSETYDNNYPPLTTDQQSQMSATDISNWNAKAQTGLLANNHTLQNFVNNMRETLMSSVAGQSETLTAIGITTGAYTEKGKLHIDENKLKQAIQNDPQGVMNLFTQQSTSFPGTTSVRAMTGSQRQTRTNEEGLAYKLYDIIQDNVGTIRDSSGNKGLLLQEAGSSNDVSDTDNFLTNDMNTLAQKITAEQNRLNDEENRYYTEFTNMESATEQMQSQSSILASMGSS